MKKYLKKSNFRCKLYTESVTQYTRTASAITLIALVITIIVLLILAGVSLNLVAGEDGILGKAESAVDTSKKATIQEEIELLVAEAKMGYYTDYGSNTEKEEAYVKKYLNNNPTSSGATITYSGGEISYEKDGDIYTAEMNLETGKIGEVRTGEDSTTQAYNSRHPELHIPTGFSHKEGTVDTGYVISDSDGNEFVWIPVANEEVYAKKVGRLNWWMTASGGNSNNLAEIVQGDKLGITKILGEEVTSTINANQPESEIINNAGGFWVGRYEAGIENGAHSGIAGLNGWTGDSISASNSDDYWEIKKANIIVKPNSEPVRSITQSKALSIANGWRSGVARNGTVAFQSGLITGSQWDAMCNFIGWSTCNSDCSSWGNYGNVKSKIYTESIWHSSDFSSDWVNETGVQKGNSTATASDGSTYFTNRFIFPTGIFVNIDNGNTMKKNIYDVAGNVWEWTTEVPVYRNGNNSVIRGGSAQYISSNFLGGYRDGNPSSTTVTSSDIGFRIVLYVE